MISLDTNMPGKQGFFGKLKPHLKELGFTIDRNKDGHHAYFNGLLTSQGGKKLYLRLPFQVIQKESDQPSDQIEFGAPVLINQAPLSNLIPTQKSQQQQEEHNWKRAGEQAVQQILNHIDNNL
ncbi:YugN family protein [Oceanobacillus sp. J11TS1]|uniref:YugN family protein n=1 Tax=Oceanobacillus sp. J11TS1 TaxID=2807191 RepID=UPI001B1BF46D|nr:YugN family protein [Oceanobacillus sp. J11TS1]GIO23368.1 hypothetical protein J11TS1_19490 [Oceanobacillus sp. J11TS1]